MWLNQYSSQLLPIVALIGLRVFVGLGDRFLRLVTKPKKDPMQVSRRFVSISGTLPPDPALQTSRLTMLLSVKLCLLRSASVIIGDVYLMNHSNVPPNATRCP